MFDKEYSEKRDFIRMYVNADIKFSVNGKKKIFSGKSKDLSGEGVSFITAEKLSEGDTLQLTLSAEEAKVAPLELNVSVVRVTAEADQTFFVAAKTNR